MFLRYRSALFVVGTMLASSAFAGGILNASYSIDKTFTDQLGSSTAGLAFDGTNYWSVSGGSNDGVRLAEYTSAGALINAFSPGLDFRAVFTAGTTVYASVFSSNTIYRQSSPGVFSPFLMVTGASLDAQTEILLNSNGTEYDGLAGPGIIDRWGLSGAFLGTVALNGYGTQGSEGIYPENARFAQAGAYFLTYDGTGVLSAWNASGTRVAITVLTGAGTSFDSDFSLSYADSRVWIATVSGGSWDGYNLGLTAATPEPASYGLALFGLAIVATRVRLGKR